MSQVTIAALYKFVALPDYEQMQAPLLAKCQSLALKGTLLLAHEGVNGTVAGTEKAIAELLDYLRSDPRLADIEHKESLIFAYLGLLKYLNRINCLSNVTGARKDHSSGVIYKF